MRVFLFGYYGFNNYGDELLLRSCIKILKDIGTQELYLLFPKRGSRKSGNMKIEQVQRTSFREIRKAIDQCDLVVGGGGNIFQDETSSRSFWYYDSLVSRALKKNKPVVLLGQGLGRISRGWNYRRLHKILTHPLCTAIFRDPCSYRYAHRYSPESCLGTDLGYGFLSTKEKPAQVSGKLGIMLKTPWPGLESMIPILQAEGIKEIELMVSHAREELSIHSDLEERLKPLIPVNLRMGDINEITETIASCSWMITERLHGAIVASFFGVPFMIQKSFKMTAFFRGFKGFNAFFRDKHPTEIGYALSQLRCDSFSMRNKLFVKNNLERYSEMVIWMDNLAKAFHSKSID